MASRPLAVTAGLLVAGLTLGPVAALLTRAEGVGTLKPGDWDALRFTIWQALLSASASVALAIPAARALSRRRFAGRRLLISILGAPFILPVIVAILGLIAVFGQNGLLNSGLRALGAPGLSIYGLQGIVLAHVFFNLPLATRMILQGWQAIPAERFRLAASLGLTQAGMRRTLEYPMLLRIVPSAFVVIFVICLSSFAVALTLGGGPRATTVELAIYQALRFDFDLGRVAMLALIQLTLALTAGLLALQLACHAGFGVGLDRDLPRWDGQSRVQRVGDALWITAVALFLLAPLVSVVAKGVPGIAALGPDAWRAMGNSVLVATASTLLCLLWALPLATRAGETIGLAGISVSPLVIGAGLFVILRAFANPFAFALPITILVNALVALPFALRILRPEAETVRQDFQRLSATLGLSKWAWTRYVLLPRLKPALGFAAGLTAALSMGDLGVIALFGDPDRETLPLHIYRLMGAYRSDAAAGGALVLLALSLTAFWVLDRGGRARAGA